MLLAARGHFTFVQRSKIPDVGCAGSIVSDPNHPQGEYQGEYHELLPIV
jgi:hypothetical protein